MKAEIQKAESNPITLISTAIEKGLDPDKLEKLFELQERWEKKEAAKAFKFAFSQWQWEKPRLIKSKKVSFKTKNGGQMLYNYAPLAKTQILIDPILSKSGLTYRWETQFKEALIIVTCILTHSDGHEERTTMQGPHDQSGQKNAIQSIGSSTSFLKRYTLEAAVGLASDDDRDANTKPTTIIKDILEPGGKLWDKALESIKNGTGTIEAIEKKYSISSSTKELLIESIDVDELKLLFDLVEDKIPPSDRAHIERILEEEQSVNYSKVLFTLNKLRNA